ncbi:hypothetical protein IWX49DRAFT_311634 [Phyllosticta citricarpa]|uniref:Uncharacterized protein n=1 Tax=Phyllosticta citricarpa TaxID=55181 RepID=A0ABR1LG58_9PEZI
MRACNSKSILVGVLLCWILLEWHGIAWLLSLSPSFYLTTDLPSFFSVAKVLRTYIFLPLLVPCVDVKRAWCCARAALVLVFVYLVAAFTTYRLAVDKCRVYDLVAASISPNMEGQSFVP